MGKRNSLCGLGLMTELSRIVGSEDRWVLTPGNTVLKVVGSGEGPNGG